MFKLLPFLGFFNAFYSPLGMISYLGFVRVFKVKFGLFDLIFMLYSVSLLSFNLVTSDFSLVVTTFRFYFGFICFYIFFKSGEHIRIEWFITVLIIIVPLEALMINLFVSPHSMPNFPSADMASHFNPGGYQRPYSFAGNSSVSSSILVILLSLVSISFFRKTLAFISVFIFSSGTGLLSLAFLFVMKRIRIFLILFILSLFCIVLFSFKLIYLFDSFGLKVNSKYILFLIDFKLSQVSYHFNGFTVFDFLFGNVEALTKGYGGDFGWLYYIIGYGLFSFVLLLFFVLSKATKETIIPIVIALFATAHYPVIFFLSGQIVLGYLMSLKYRFRS